MICKSHELIIAKLNISNTNTINQTIWGQLQAHTSNDCPNVNCRLCGKMY